MLTRLEGRGVGWLQEKSQSFAATAFVASAVACRKVRVNGQTLPGVRQFNL